MYSLSFVVDGFVVLKGYFSRVAFLIIFLRRSGNTILSCSTQTRILCAVSSLRLGRGWLLPTSTPRRLRCRRRAHLPARRRQKHTRLLRLRPRLWRQLHRSTPRLLDPGEPHHQRDTSSTIVASLSLHLSPLDHPSRPQLLHKNSSLPRSEVKLEVNSSGSSRNSFRLPPLLQPRQSTTTPTKQLPGDALHLSI